MENGSLKTTKQKDKSNVYSYLAIAAVLCVLSFFINFFVELLSIFPGITALVKAWRSQKKRKEKIFAITASIVTLIVALISLSVQLHNNIALKNLNDRLICTNNLRELGLAMALYNQDCKEKYPTPKKWCDQLIQVEYIPKDRFICPAANKGTCHFAMNKWVPENASLVPADLVILFESKDGWNQCGGPELLTTHYHNKEGCNVLFGAGYVSFIETEEIDELMWTVDGNN